MNLQREQLVSQIAAARTATTRLYLCGVNHNPASNFATQGQVVVLVEPQLILLEGRTPDQVYDGKKQQPSGFAHELKNPNIPMPVPNLASIKHEVDVGQLLVRGFDVNEDTDDSLVVKHQIDNQALVEEMERFKATLERIPGEDAVLRAAIRRFNPIFGRTINQALENARVVRKLTDQFIEANSIFATCDGLRAHCARIEAYLDELERMLAANIKQSSVQYERTLVFIGAGHLQEDRLLRHFASESYSAFSIAWINS